MTIAVAEIAANSQLHVTSLIVRGPDSFQDHIGVMVRRSGTSSCSADPSVNKGVFYFAGERGYVCLATVLSWIDDDGWTVYHSSVDGETEEHDKTWTYLFKKKEVTVPNK